MVIEITMDKIKTLLVEDEPKGMNLLRTMVKEYCPDLDVVGEASFVEEVVEKTESLKPDLLVMDISLFNETAFDALDKLQHQPEIIFTTAYDKYALRAFKYSVTDYLMKPIAPSALLKAVDKVKKLVDAKARKIAKQDSQNFPNTIGRIALPTLNGLVIKDIETILYITADGNYSRVYFEGGESTMISESIKGYEDLLRGYNFFRVHKSYIVNTAHMKKYLRGRGGFVVMDNEELIPVAARRRNLFIKFLKKAI